MNTGEATEKLSLFLNCVTFLPWMRLEINKVFFPFYFHNSLLLCLGRLYFNSDNLKQSIKECRYREKLSFKKYVLVWLWAIFVTKTSLPGQNFSKVCQSWCFETLNFYTFWFYMFLFYCTIFFETSQYRLKTVMSSWQL